MSCGGYIFFFLNENKSATTCTLSVPCILEDTVVVVVEILICQE